MRAILSTVMLAAAMSFTAAAQAQYLIVGNDEKVVFKDGKPVMANGNPNTLISSTRCVDGARSPRGLDPRK